MKAPTPRRPVPLAAAVLVLAAVSAEAAPETYVTMRDGAKIAVSVHFPEGGDPENGTWPTVLEISGYDGGSAEGRTMLGEAADAAWKPATGESFEEPFESGFALTSDSRQLTASLSDRYVVVHASLRGTGCSSGEFDVYSLQSSLDGYEIIEWIAAQAWSNGDVAIFGHSYSGMTGFLIAATQPPHLRAVSVSGLIEDVYRGILYPGGVSNYGFPLFWSAGIRPASDLFGGTLPGLVRPEGPEDDDDRAERCAEHFATRPQDPRKHPVLRGGSSEFDGPWFRATALLSSLNGDLFTLPEPFAYPPPGGDPRPAPVTGIAVPIHVTAAYEDEQTGGRGPTALWERIGTQCRPCTGGVVCETVPVPKRLLLTNGDHNTQNPKFSGPEVLAERRAWLDHWMGLSDEGFGTLDVPQVSTSVLLEKRKHGSGETPPIGGRIEALCGPGGDAGNESEPCFPLPETSWTRYYLQPDESLSTAAPAVADASQSFFAGPAARQGWFYAGWSAGLDAGPPATTAEGPDELTFRTEPFTNPTTIAGPIVARLWAATTNTDDGGFAGGDLFVQVLDEGPGGELSWLQRGMLRMRHQPLPPPGDPLGERHDSYDGVTYRFWRYHSEEATADFVAGTAFDEPNPYDVEIWPTGHVFRPGHRLVVKIHAAPAIDEYYAYAPRHRPLSQTTIWHDAGRPSHLVFPVVPTPLLDPEAPACGELEGVRCVESPGLAP